MEEREEKEDQSYIQTAISGNSGAHLADNKCSLLQIRNGFCASGIQDTNKTLTSILGATRKETCLDNIFDARGCRKDNIQTKESCKETCLDNIVDARGCRKDNIQTKESCSSGWNLFMGQSSLCDIDTHQGAKIRKAA
ncbi:hypothetical protein OIU74_023294 [Salix koriyanagi]|uniref:Uncharacterized protein n=1 Tax=Salix koriyanagi TaxID=2511006 RepID=A0A9Q1AAX4_9ROSI|nr:hypothetical protein OIU74_023294 [Salix koriyanagi]